MTEQEQRVIHQKEEPISFDTALQPSVEPAADGIVPLERGLSHEDPPTEADNAMSQPPHKTKFMLEIENRLGEGIDVLLLRRLYHDEQMSMHQIASEFGVSLVTIHAWMRRYDILRRSRSEAFALTWATRSDEITAKIHTPESDQKRSDSHKRHYRENPDAYEKLLENLKTLHENHVESARQRREEAFGDDLQERLRLLHYGEKHTIEEIAEMTGFSISTISRLMKKYGIEHITPSKKWHEKNAQVSKLLPFIWIDPSILHTLTLRQREVLERRHLLENSSPTLEEIGVELGVTRQRVEHLEQRAIQELQKATTVFDTKNTPFKMRGA